MNKREQKLSNELDYFIQLLKEDSKQAMNVSNAMKNMGISLQQAADNLRAILPKSEPEPKVIVWRVKDRALLKACEGDMRRVKNIINKIEGNNGK
jgi:PleD family two-component response regulator